MERRERMKGMQCGDLSSMIWGFEFAEEEEDCAIADVFGDWKGPLNARSEGSHRGLCRA
jgi:hypothetical protein